MAIFYKVLKKQLSPEELKTNENLCRCKTEVSDDTDQLVQLPGIFFL